MIDRITSTSADFLSRKWSKQCSWEIVNNRKEMPPFNFVSMSMCNLESWTISISLTLRILRLSLNQTRSAMQSIYVAVAEYANIYFIWWIVAWHSGVAGWVFESQPKLHGFKSCCQQMEFSEILFFMLQTTKIEKYCGWIAHCKKNISSGYCYWN